MRRLSLGVASACLNAGLSPSFSLALDWLEDATRVYAQNLGHLSKCVATADVTTVFGSALGARLRSSEREIQRDCGEVDFLVAGPPCQGHSDLNNSTRRIDPRNALYLNAARAIEVLKPMAFIIENVPSVVHDRTSSFEDALRTICGSAYSTASGTIDSSELGLPQKRVRHFLIGSKAADIPPDFLQTFSAGRRPLGALEAIRDLESKYDVNSVFDSSSKMSPENTKRVRYLFSRDEYELPDRLRPDCHKKKKHSYNSVYGRIRPHDPSQTITSGFGSMGQGRFIHPLQPRTVTPHEAARLQSFPDFLNLMEWLGAESCKNLSGMLFRRQWHRRSYPK